MMTPNSPMTTASLVLGICAIIIGLVPCLGLFAVACGGTAIYLGQQERQKQPSNATAKTGMVLGGIGIGVTLIAVLGLAHSLGQW